MPTVANTGVPQGLSIPTTQYGYFGEGVTDTRPVEALTVATPTTVPGMSAPDANGICYLPNNTSPQIYDHIDFTNLVLIVGSGVPSIVFNKCKFATTDPALSLNRAQGNLLIQFLGANTAITIRDCSADGSLPDPNFAIAHFLSLPSGNTSAGGVTILRNNVKGFSTLLDLGAWTTFSITDNYCHDPVIDKHSDVSPYTNSAVWAHVDGFQIGASNTVGTGVVRNNVLLAFSVTVRGSTGPLQVGQMAGPAPATITSFVFDGNWLDGGSYVVGANLNTAISVLTRFEVTNNHVGLDYQYGIDGGNTVHSLATLWAGNTYAKTGQAGRNTPVAVTAGQLIP